MTTRLNPCLPLEFEEKIFEEVVDKAKDWALMHGACMRSKANFSKDILQFAPFVLLPSVFPRREFQKAVDLQPLINELIHRIAYNHEFLSDALSVTITVDPYTAALYKIYETVRAEGISQAVTLGLVRSDVMLSAVGDTYEQRQVEFNTIAAGFGWLGPASGLIHRVYVAGCCGLITSSTAAARGLGAQQQQQHQLQYVKLKSIRSLRVSPESAPTCLCSISSCCKNSAMVNCCKT